MKTIYLVKGKHDKMVAFTEKGAAYDVLKSRYSWSIPTESLTTLDLFTSHVDYERHLEREESKATETRLALLKESALAKLSTEEREALGV